MRRRFPKAISFDVTGDGENESDSWSDLAIQDEAKGAKSNAEA